MERLNSIIRRIRKQSPVQTDNVCSDEEIKKETYSGYLSQYHVSNEMTRKYIAIIDCDNGKKVSLSDQFLAVTWLGNLVDEDALKYLKYLNIHHDIPNPSGYMEKQTPHNNGENNYSFERIYPNARGLLAERLRFRLNYDTGKNTEESLKEIDNKFINYLKRHELQAICKSIDTLTKALKDLSE